MTRIRLALTLLAACLVANLVPAAASAQKIAVVDMQRAITETEDGRSARKKVQKLIAKKQSELKREEAELIKKLEGLQKQKSVLTDAKYKVKEEALLKEQLKLREMLMASQRELASKENELLVPITSRMMRILKRLGQKNGYSIILRSETVLWVPASQDLTDQLVQRYNKGEGR
jgi:outer membrane protein